MNVWFGLGVGSTYSVTAGAWAGSAYYSATGATSVVGTNGATFYITGVQLERGSTASSFEYRPFGTELALCQRYFECNLNYGTTIANFSGGNNSAGVRAMYVSGNAGGSQGWNHDWKVSKRATPTVTIYSSTSPYTTGAIAGGSSPTITNTGTNSAFIFATGSNMYFNFIVEAEL